jgi:hypothetical protein
MRPKLRHARRSRTNSGSSIESGAPDMIHTRISAVSFRSPFTLPGLDRTYPAGTYDVATDEEQLDLSFAAFRRIETRIRLPYGAETTYWPVAPHDLEHALAEDRRTQPA